MPAVFSSLPQVWLPFLFAATAAGVAGRALPAQGSPPPADTLRTSGPGTTATAFVFARPLQVNELSDRRLLVNDGGSRRVVMLDSTLANAAAVIDSAADGPTRSYGRSVGTLMSFGGDSSIFFDATSQSFVLIHPDGSLGRVMASPIPNNVVVAILASAYSVSMYAPPRGMLYTGAKPRGSGFAGMSMVDDSSAVLVARFDSRVLDTLTSIKRIEYHVRPNASGVNTSYPAIYPTLDEWSGFPDGTIGVLRGRDLRFELYLADGSRKDLPRLPFEWQRLDDDRKQQIADSITAVRMETYNTRMELLTARGGGAGAAGAGVVITPRPPDPVDPTTLPDFFPAFGMGGMRGDLEGNFWIRLAPPNYGAPNTYMVVNREGSIVKRVAIPERSNIIGFGPNSTVYLTSYDASTARIIRTKWR